MKRKEEQEVYVARLDFYNTHFMDLHWMPADMKAHFMFLEEKHELIFTCPVLYALGIASKDQASWEFPSFLRYRKAG